LHPPEISSQRTEVGPGRGFASTIQPFHADHASSMSETIPPPPGDEDAAAATPASVAHSADPTTPAPAPDQKLVPLNPAECAQRLKQLFPALFGGAVKPLKLRIQLDIQQRAPGVFTKQALSAFFRRHTGSTSYLMAVAKATQRFDLDGQPSGELSQEHRQVALDELARRRANQQSRRELEEQQRRNRAGLLHDFQTTTLTKANFCALKGVPVDELDGLLEIARGEAAERARQAPPAAGPRGPGRPHGPNRPQRPHGGPPRSGPR
jgi:ProP effector